MAAILFSAISAPHAQDFQTLQPPCVGCDLTQAYNVSADGLVVAGSFRATVNNNTIIYPSLWTAASGMVGLELPPGYSLGPPQFVSADGSVLVGTLGGLGSIPFRWTASTGFANLGLQPGAVASTPNAVNADGSVIVGSSQFSTNQAWRWTSPTGMVGLGVLAGSNFSVASGVSGNGSVVVGYSGIDQSTTQAFRWTSLTGMVGLGFLAAYSDSVASATNQDGSVVVGFGTNGFFNSPSQAFRWTTAAGLVGLGWLPGHNSSTASGVNADGSVVIGSSEGQAFRWTAAVGMQSIRDMLVANGNDLSGFPLTNATGISADGTVIVGNGDPSGFHAWIARIPLNAFALLDLNGVDRSIGSLLWGGTVTNSGASAATLTAGSDNADTTFNGFIRDGASATALIKTGTGTLILTRLSTYTGLTTIDAGSLVVIGDISSSSGVMIKSGGTLGGNGIVPTTTIDNGGFLAPGAIGIPGTLNVSGAVTFNSNSTYSVLFSPIAISKVVATGAATLVGGTVAVTAQPGVYLAGSYKILSANGFVGTFAGLTLNGTLAGVRNPHLTYSSNDVFLTFDQATTRAILPAFSSVNISNVSSGIDNAISNGTTLSSAFQKLFGLNGSSLTYAFTQLAGEVGARGGAQAGTQMMGAFLSLLLNPFSGTSSGNPGSVGIGRSFVSERGLSPGTALAYAAVTPRDAQSTQSLVGKGFDRPWGIWGQAYGGFNKTNGDAVFGSHDTTARSYGFATGADYRLSPEALFGFALAGGGTSWGLSDGLGSGRGDVFQLGIYGSKNFGAAFVSAALTYARHWMNTDRTVTVSGFDKLTADFSAHNSGGRVETGYRVDLPLFGVTPYAALQIQNFRTPSYNEVAAFGSNAFGLAYDTKSTTATRAELGVWFDKAYVLDRGLLALRARAAWAHDYSSEPSINATFQTLPGSSFTVNGASVVPDSLLISAGADYRHASGLSFGAKFDGELANRSRTYAGNAVIRYVW